MTTQDRKEMQEMAQYVFENGEIVDETPFVLRANKNVHMLSSWTVKDIISPKPKTSGRTFIMEVDGYEK